MTSQTVISSPASHGRMSAFARAIMEQKYSHTVDGRKEDWHEIARRVVEHVTSVVDISPEQRQAMIGMIARREFMPGGRYLYSAGNDLHQCNNCLMMRAEDSREGWADLLHKAAMALMTGAGIGVDYSAVRPKGSLIARTGGTATGPLALMQMVNEAGRGIRQGGDRRSALWAALNWAHADIFDFIRMKDWSPEVRALKEANFDFPATMDGTNISVQLDDEFFAAYQDRQHPKHQHAQDVYWLTVKQMLKKAEPGFSVDTGSNAGETLRNAPVTGDTHILTDKGYVPAFDLVGRPANVWTGKQFAPNVVFQCTNPEAQVVKVNLSNGRYIRCDVTHPFLVYAWHTPGSAIEQQQYRSELDAPFLGREDVLRIPAEKLERGMRLLVEGPLPNRRAVLVTSVEPQAPEAVFCADVGVPEHSFMAEGVIVSNCTEITSHDDSDICNLGSINMSRITSLEHMAEVVTLGTMFLLAGTVYSDVPYAKVQEVRTKNRRLGLGLMGLHEWLAQRGKPYGPDEELAEYLSIYATSTRIADDYACRWNISAPVKTRAIAPTGTIAIVAETTSGMEPIFCVALKRRYKQGSATTLYQYVLDPTAQRLIDSGVEADSIEDAYTLAENPERRVAFQAWLQQFVDHGISSTINLPEWGSAHNNETLVQQFGDMLMQHLPNLRGITCYPDGARGGQPLTRVPYEEAAASIGQVFVEQTDVCDITKGGSCGI